MVLSYIHPSRFFPRWRPTALPMRRRMDSSQSNPMTVQITIDPINPTINWVAPVQNGKILKVNNQMVQLQANATDNYSIDRVRFFRWDAIYDMYVDIGVVNNSPFEWILDTSILNYQWNQVFVSVKDGAGNTAIQFIWIFRNLPIRNFMPTIRR